MAWVSLAVPILLFLYKALYTVYSAGALIQNVSQLRVSFWSGPERLLLLNGSALLTSDMSINL